MLDFIDYRGFGKDVQVNPAWPVIEVTNRNNSGTGSFRAACEQTGGAFVVFNVGGTFQLNDQVQIKGNKAICGFTAPEPVVFTRARIRIAGSNVVVQGITTAPTDSQAGQDPDSRDGVSAGRSGVVVRDVYIHQCDAFWALDEGMSIWGDVQRITYDSCLIAEGLHDSIHPKGPHSTGMIFSPDSSKATVIQCAFISNHWRNIQCKGDQLEFINNLVVNYGPVGFAADRGGKINLINNHYIAGQNSNGNKPFKLSGDPGAVYYLIGNIGEKQGAGAISTIPAFTPVTTSYLPTSQVYDHVLSHAGATYRNPSDVRNRIIQSVLDVNRTTDFTAKIINSQDEVGGLDYVWPLAQNAVPVPGDNGPPASEFVIIDDGVSTALTIDHVTDKAGVYTVAAVNAIGEGPPSAEAISNPGGASPTYGAAIVPSILNSQSGNTLTNTATNTYRWLGDGSSATTLKYDVTIGTEYQVQINLVSKGVTNDLKISDASSGDMVPNFNATVAAFTHTAVDDDFRITRTSGVMDIEMEIIIREVL